MHKGALLIVFGTVSQLSTLFQHQDEKYKASLNQLFLNVCFNWEKIVNIHIQVHC